METYTFNAGDKVPSWIQKVIRGTAEVTFTVDVFVRKSEDGHIHVYPVKEGIGAMKMYSFGNPNEEVVVYGAPTRSYTHPYVVDLDSKGVNKG